MLANAAKYRHTLKWAVPLVVFFWCLAYLTTSRSTYVEVARTFRDERKLFLQDFLQHDVEGREFDGSSLAEMCRSKTWKKDLILSCEPVAEGIGSVRNAQLQCIRLAIEMGAALIYPDIVRRNDHDIAKPIPHSKGPLIGRGESLSYFFDYDHLNNSLARYCPQMKTYASLNVLSDVPGVLTGLKVKIGDLTADLANGTVLARPALLAQQIENFVHANDDGRRRPLRVQLASSLFWFPTAHDPPHFAASFGGLLRVRPDARRLAGAVLFAMKKLKPRDGHRLAIDWDPHRRAGEPAEGFMGVRIRTDRDVWAKNWPGYDEQAPYFLNSLAENRERFPLVYLAQGCHPDNVTAFAARAADFNVSVVRKEDLLAPWPTDASSLRRLTWDQRALVDYEVMMRAGMVAGIAQSSFAWNLALRRATVYSGSGGAPPAIGEGAGDDDALPSGRIMYRDRWSVVFGPGVNDAVEKAAGAMQATIWP